MEVTLNIPESIISKLVNRVGDKPIDFEEHILSYLDHEASQEISHEDWVSINRRRQELIFKSNKTDLSSKEKTELKHLQELADKRLEALDSERLTQSETMLKEVKSLLHVEG